MKAYSDRHRIVTFRRAAILAIVILLGQLALTLSLQDDWLRSVVSDWLAPVENLLAVIALSYAARCSTIHSRRLGIAWGILALAQLSFTFGNLTWAIIEIVLRQQPFPSAADVFYLTYYPLFLVGILYLPATRLERGELLKTLLDIGIVMLAAVLVFWNFLIGPLAVARAEDPSALAFSVAYPAFDLVLLLAILVLLYRRWEMQRHSPLLLLAGSATVQILTDCIYSYQFLSGTYVSGGLLGLGWVAGYLLAALAGVLQAVTVQPATESEPRRKPSTWSLYLPYVWLGAVFLLLIWSHGHELPMGFPILALGVSGIMGLAVIRQMIAVNENARLHRQLQKELSERKQTEEALRAQKQLFENLVTVARATAERPPLKATLQNVLNVAATLTGAENGVLILLDETGAVTRCINMHGQEPAELWQGIAMRVMDRGLSGWVARHRQAALIPDTSNDERWLTVPEVPYTIRSALSVPILSGLALAGVLTLVHSQPGHFDNEQFRLMQAAADQMALAVRNAQMFDAQCRMAGRQTTLFEVLRTVSRGLEPDAVARRAVEAIASLTGWSDVAITLPDEEQMYWVVRAASGGLSPAAGMTRPIGEGVTGRVFRTSQTQVVNDVSADPDYITGHPNTRSELAVPLRRGGRVSGVLDIESDRLAAFGDEDVQLAESLAEAVALALDNARLYEETNRLRVFNENIVRNMEEGILIENATGHITFVNPRTAELLGYTLEELIGKHWTTIVPPENVAIIERETAQRPRGIASRYETVLLTKESRRVPVIVSARPLFEGGRFTGVLSVFTDITERKHAEEALQESEARYRAIIEDQTELICRWRPDGTLIFVNHAYCRYFGKTRQELIGHSFMLFIPEADRAIVQAQVALLCPENPAATIEHRAIIPDGTIRWQQWTHRLICNEEQHPIEFQSVGRDITERRQAEERLLYLSTHDALTGLYNRAYFEEELARIERGRRFPVSIVMGDVDDLKTVNDTLGHPAGDQLLRRAAQVLKSVFRAEDVIARIGGDEFAILLPEAGVSAARQALTRLRSKVELHNRDHREFPLSFSLGVATADKGYSLAETLKEADRHMYQDKFSKSND